MSAGFRLRRHSEKKSTQEWEKGERGRTYIDWADEVLVAHEYIRHSEAKEYCQDPGSDKPLDCLLWGKLDQLRAAECDAANVSEDIVRNDQRSRQEEPDHALKDVVHNEMRLDND